MADPKRQLIRLIERAQTDDIVREGQRERGSYGEKPCIHIRLVIRHVWNMTI